MSYFSVSVIIPNWNGMELLKDCLFSLQKQTAKNFEIIVVDNGSTDKSVDFVRKNFSQIKIVQLEKNYGFAKAINEGVKSSTSKYVAFLNNDTAVDRNWLKALLTCVRGHPNVASISSKLLNFYDREKIDGLGIEVNEVGQAKSIGWEQKDKGQFEKERYVFGATGGAALFDREIFIKVGLFDESFFMYSEEVDWAFRAQFQGYESLYCPGIDIFMHIKL